MRRPPLFAARSEYAERSDAREGECGRHRPPCLPPEPIARRGGATWAATRAAHRGEARRATYCCQQRRHRRRERAEALTRRTSGPLPMGSSPGRSSRPDTPRRPARFPRPASGAAARTRAPGRGGVNLCRPLVQPLTRAQNGRGAKERPLLCFQREYMFFSTTAPPAKSRSKCTKKGCRQGLCAN